MNVPAARGLRERRLMRTVAATPALGRRRRVTSRSAETRSYDGDELSLNFSNSSHADAIASVDRTRRESSRARRRIWSSVSNTPIARATVAGLYRDTGNTRAAP